MVYFLSQIYIMPSCREKVEIWSPNIKVGDTYMQYNVTLERHFVCFGQEKKYLFINDRQIYDFGLATNFNSRKMWAPPSHYEWNENGHSFLLVFNPLSCSLRKDHRLFVDGIDVRTGHEFSNFWRFRGHLFMFWGALLLLIGIGGIVLTALQGLGFLWLPINAICWGFILFFSGFAAIYRLRKQTLNSSEIIPNEHTVIWKHSTLHVV